MKSNADWLAEALDFERDNARKLRTVVLFTDDADGRKQFGVVKSQGGDSVTVMVEGDVLGCVESDMQIITTNSIEDVITELV